MVAQTAAMVWSKRSNRTFMELKYVTENSVAEEDFMF